MASLLRVWAQFREDRYQQLAAAGVLVVCTIAALEVWVPNAARLTIDNEQLEAENLIDFIPTRLKWDVPFQTGWSAIVFDYRVLIIASILCGFILFLINARSTRRTRSLQRILDQSLERRPIPGRGTMERGDEVRPQLRFAIARRETFIEPLIGGWLITTLAWLAAVLVAGKADPSWSRPFLAPPFLVAQNLQHFGAELLASTIRSIWHLAQGLLWGSIAGILLGFILSHARWLQRSTAWHLTVVSALPPFILIEVFKQIARLPGFPALWVHGEVAFKSAIAMASWAVTWPVLAATAHALSTIDQEYRFSTRLLGARSLLERLRHIDLPVIFPAALSNIRVGIVIGLIVLLYGEAQGGPARMPTLGYYFSAFTSDFKLQCLMALLVFTSLLVVFFELVTRFLELGFVSSRSQLSKLRENILDFRESAVEERRSCLEKFEQQRELKWRRPPWSSASEDPLIHIRAIRKLYGEAVAFELGGEMTVNRGQFVSVIGSSGAGKSTLLKLLLGFEMPEPNLQALLRIGDLNMARPSRELPNTAERLICYISQRPLLLPHATVEQNLLFGIRQQWTHLRSTSATSDTEFFRDYLSWLTGRADPRSWTWRRDSDDFETPLGLLIRFLSLEGKMTNYPRELSGGEAQRVHLLRWLVLSRPLLIMDEAFSALDQPLKGMVRDAIYRHTKALGITVINVSHDRSDVLQVSDRIIFIDSHTVRDDAKPRELYYAPRTRDLAIFLGHTNLFAIEINESNLQRVVLRRDAYRNITFDPPIEIKLQEQLAAPRPTGSQQRRGDQQINRTNSASQQDSHLVAETLMFIARSDVNITALEISPSVDSHKYFLVDTMRFTGTHYELRLSRVEPGGRLRIDTVIQDDELQELLERIIPGGATRENDREIHARIAIRRGLVIEELT